MFNETNAKWLETALLKIAKEEVGEVIHTHYGIKYVILGELNTPKNTTIRLKTVWIIEQGADNPRFVTAYPAKE